MAFEVKKIHPLDLQPRKAVGVSLPFSAKDVFLPTYTTQEAIKVNLINYILTGRGERFLNPDFGIDLRSLLFEQLVDDKIEELDYKIRQGISEWFPNVVINKIEITSDKTTGVVRAYMKYGVQFTNIQDELLINFEQ
jgi:phage baseplate assembly protein W